MRVCLSPHVQDPRAQNVNCDWPQLATYFRSEAGKTRGTTKEDQPMISFGAFAGSVTNDTLDAEGLWAVALDFDHVPDEAFRNAVELAQKLSPEGLAHTTFSHGASCAKCPPGGATHGRIVIPFTAPVPAHLWSATWPTFERTFREQAGAQCDPVCHNVGRRYWLPSVTPAGAPWLSVWGAP